MCCARRRDHIVFEYKGAILSTSYQVIECLEVHVVDQHPRVSQTEGRPIHARGICREAYIAIIRRGQETLDASELCFGADHNAGVTPHALSIRSPKLKISARFETVSKFTADVVPRKSAVCRNHTPLCELLAACEGDGPPVPARHCTRTYAHARACVCVCVCLPAADAPPDARSFFYFRGTKTKRPPLPASRGQTQKSSRAATSPCLVRAPLASLPVVACLRRDGKSRRLASAPEQHPTEMPTLSSAARRQASWTERGAQAAHCAPAAAVGQQGLQEGSPWDSVQVQPLRWLFPLQGHRARENVRRAPLLCCSV